MTKRVVSLFFAILFVFCAIKTVQISAVSPMPEKCSLTINYQKNGKGFENLEINIYQVAKMLEDGSFEKSGKFASCPVSVYDITSNTEWKQTALTLEAYTNKDKIKPYKTEFTSNKGWVEFSDLECGLYLVRSVSEKRDNAYYYFDSFLTYLPMVQDDDYKYNVYAQPKPSEVIIDDKLITYKVLKLWKDIGNKEQRPKSITVDILKNGVVNKSVKLSNKNNWFYSFKAKNDGSVWSVVERNVPKKYSVKIANNKTMFVITNTHKDSEKPENNKKPPYSDAPKTGLGISRMVYFVIMCISGLMLVIIGVGGLRSRKNEQKE